jgi:hypothetical protein
MIGAARLTDKGIALEHLNPMTGFNKRRWASGSRYRDLADFLIDRRAEKRLAA